MRKITNYSITQLHIYIILPHPVYSFHPNSPLCLKQIEVADEHPQPGKAESGWIMGVHFIHQGVGRVAALLDKRQGFIFTLVNAVALFLDELAMVLEGFAVAGVNPVHV